MNLLCSPDDDAIGVVGFPAGHQGPFDFGGNGVAAMLVFLWQANGSYEDHLAITSDGDLGIVR